MLISRVDADAAPRGLRGQPQAGSSIYRAEGLQLRARPKRGVRYIRGNAVPTATRPNERWSLDFVHDFLSAGRKFRSLTIVDDFTRESIGIEVDFSLTSDRVVRMLASLSLSR
jgi:putative transposase